MKKITGTLILVIAFYAVLLYSPLVWEDGWKERFVRIGILFVIISIYVLTLLAISFVKGKLTSER